MWWIFLCAILTFFTQSLLVPHSHLTFNYSQVPQQPVNYPTTSFASFQVNHNFNDDFGAREHFETCRHIQFKTWGEIKDICQNKTTLQLFKDYSHYANPYYLGTIRTQAGYEEFILDLNQRYTKDHKYRKKLRYVKGFINQGDFLKLVDAEADRIKALQQERARQKLEKQKQLEAAAPYRWKINDQGEYQNLLAGFKQGGQSAQAAGDGILATRYQQRISAIEKTLKNSSPYDYSRSIKSYPTWNDADGHVFNNRFGTALDQQLHEELCDIRVQMLKLESTYPSQDYPHFYAPIVYRCTALAKQENNPTVAFSLSDYSDALVTIVSQGMYMLNNGMRAIAQGQKLIAQSELLDNQAAGEVGLGSAKGIVRTIKHGPQRLANLVTAMPAIVLQSIAYLAYEHGRIEELDRALAVGDIDLFMSHCDEHQKENQARLETLHENLKETVSHISSLSAHDLAMHGTYFGTSLALDGVALKALALAVSPAGRELVKDVATAFKSCKAEQTMVEVAGIGKIAVEEGSEFAINVLPSMMLDQEFLSSKLLGEGIADKLRNFIVRKKGKFIGKNIQTGAQEISAKEFLAGEAWAEQQYEFFRKHTNDVQMIAHHTGLPHHKINRIKKHLFFDEHVLYHGVDKLYPSKPIAEAWNRLMKGVFSVDDLKLLEHEYFEAKFETIFKTTNRIAHDKTELRCPSPLVGK